MMGFIKSAALALALFTAPGAAAAPSDPTPTAKEIEFFIDDFMARIQAQEAGERLPGAVFSVVKDGKVAILKGYGEADTEKHIPMSPTKSVVRVASVSKLFTATGALQLVEDGALDLDRDVNSILVKFKVFNPFKTPVTMRHLLTHAAGLDERFVGLVTHTNDELLPLGEYLKKRLPRVVYAPGETMSYSNHGFALAGHIIELVSGLSFEEYMQKHIFRPLGMADSSFMLPARLVERLAQGHEKVGTQLTQVDMDYISTGPASSLITTASDISRFMIAQLEGGVYGGRRLLGEKWVKAMQSHQFSLDPTVQGMGFAYFRHQVNGEHMVSHGGEARGWSTLFLLFPRRRLGIFFCYNRYGLEVTYAFRRELLERFFPSSPGASKQRLGGYWYNDELDGGPGAAGGKRRFAGFYRMVRHPHSGFTKIGAILAGFAAEYVVVSHDKGARLKLLTFPWLPQQKLTWQRTGPQRFEAAETGEKLLFQSSGDGAADYLSRESIPEGTFERIPWYESLWVHSLVHVLATIFLISEILTIVRRRVSFTFTNLLLAIIGGFNLAFVGGLGIFFSQVQPVELAYGVPLFMKIVLCFPLAAAILTAGLPLVVFFERRQIFVGPRQVIRFLAQAGTVYAVVFIFHYWNFIGFKYY